MYRFYYLANDQSAIYVKDISNMKTAEKEISFFDVTETKWAAFDNDKSYGVDWQLLHVNDWEEFREDMKRYPIRYIANQCKCCEAYIPVDIVYCNIACESTYADIVKADKQMVY